MAYNNNQYNQYSGYGGNPYENDGGSGNPYASDGANPYGASSTAGGYQNTTPLPQPTNYSQTQSHPVSGAVAAPPLQPGQGPNSNVQYVQPGPAVMSNPDFLQRVEAVKSDIRTLTTQVSAIAAAHQRTLASPDTASSASLESLISQTQVLNTSIRDQIKFLETDAARSRDNQVKNTQITQLKNSFSKQLQEYRQEEASYERRYKDQIARQYRIVNPDATESEVQEAANADWGNEGVFQTALKSNRSATANTVLGAVRARHNDIQKIERSIAELNRMMEDLATIVVLQDAPIATAEQHTENVKHDTEAGNQQLDKGIASARRARKLKWWCFFIVVLIIIILALVLGLYFGLPHAGQKS